MMEIGIMNNRFAWVKHYGCGIWEPAQIGPDPFAVRIIGSDHIFAARDFEIGADITLSKAVEIVKVDDVLIVSTKTSSFTYSPEMGNYNHYSDLYKRTETIVAKLLTIDLPRPEIVHRGNTPYALFMFSGVTIKIYKTVMYVDEIRYTNRQVLDLINKRLRAPSWKKN